jgi:NADH-quinone oxidoreductase subunit L
VWMQSNVISWIVLVTMISVSFLTVIYTFRLIWFVFFGEARTVKLLNVTEAPPVMRAPIVLLATCSLWFIVSWNPFDFSGWIIGPVQHATSHHWITVFSIVWIMLAIGLSWLIFRTGNIQSIGLLRNAFHIDDAWRFLFRKTLGPAASASAFIDQQVIDRVIHLSAYSQVTFAHVIGWADRYMIDGIVHFVARLASAIGGLTRSFQGGKVQLYIFWATFAIIIFIICALN